MKDFCGRSLGAMTSGRVLVVAGSALAVAVAALVLVLLARRLGPAAVVAPPAVVVPAVLAVAPVLLDTELWGGIDHGVVNIGNVADGLDTKETAYPGAEARCRVLCLRTNPCCRSSARCWYAAATLLLGATWCWRASTRRCAG